MKTYIGIKMANLDNIYSTSVKFYSSLTRRQAKGLDPIGKQDGKDIFIDSYPGAICFVSDAVGNSIFLNKLLFGDGASSGTVEVSLSSLPVVIDADGNVLKTLADYFNSVGAIISDIFLNYNSISKNIPDYQRFFIVSSITQPNKIRAKYPQDTQLRQTFSKRGNRIGRSQTYRSDPDQTQNPVFSDNVQGP